MKNFTKADLKTGMLIQYKNQEIRMVINKDIVGDGFLNLSDYYIDLTYPTDNTLDIIRVSTVLENNSLMPVHWTEHTLIKHLLWDREPKKPKKTYKIDGVKYSESSLRSLIKKATS